MKKFLIAAVVIAAAATPEAQAYDRNHLKLGIGVDNVFDDARPGEDDKTTLGGRIQWRGKSFESFIGLKNFSPQFGLDVSADGAVYGYGGLLYDWNFYDRWSLIPNISVGAYSHGGGKDLGGVLEFHDSIELTYTLDGGSRVGIELTHMSNASIYDENPGKEDIMLTYSLGL